MSRPRIALTPCSALRDYEASIERAGGEPWVLDLARDTPAEVVATAAGLLLTGGGDVLPAIYGEVAHPAFSAAEDGRDDYELKLVRRADAADLPLLAICRGLQVVNVARGGTLVQDIPSQVAGATTHAVETPRAAIAHEAWVAPESRLARLIGSEGADTSIGVNSRHHQSIARLGAGLVVTATAPDGVVEGAEDPSKPFSVGVQWHPENFYRTGEFRRLFEGFVDACGAAR